MYVRMYVYVLYMCVYVFGFHVTVLLSLIISSSRRITEVPLLLSRHLLRCVNKKFSLKTEMYFKNAIVYKAIISAGVILVSTVSLNHLLKKGGINYQRQSSRNLLEKR